MGRYLVFSMGEKWEKNQPKKVTPPPPPAQRMCMFIFLNIFEVCYFLVFPQEKKGEKKEKKKRKEGKKKEKNKRKEEKREEKEKKRKEKNGEKLDKGF